MKNYISREKLSKKARRELDSKNRLCWGAVNPVTRKTESEKIYNRKKARKGFDTDSLSEPFYFLQYRRQKINILIGENPPASAGGVLTDRQ